MTVFEMVKYHHQEYPSNINLCIEEIAAHFDIRKIDPHMDFSLHTEYSYGKRKLDSELVNMFPELLTAQKDGVPQLWKSDKWAEQFAMFIVNLVANCDKPRVIEVHSPFNDYTDLTGFIAAYSVFEEIIRDKYPEAELLIENRCGSVYRGGKFLFSKNPDIEELCEVIDKNGLKLKIAYDIIQVYTAHNVKNPEDYIRILEESKGFRSKIGGVHLWGKKKSNGRKVSHCGDLSSYFEDEGLKKAFLMCFKECFDDDIIRKMVLEVNSGNEDLLSIVNDLLDSGVVFQ